MIHILLRMKTTPKHQFQQYFKKEFNENEKKLGRKLIVSEGAMGYLYSMLNIFKNAIINNYQYIMICDDDIGVINDFVFKFNNLLINLPKFRFLMLGSSQWDWNNIKYQNDYYLPNFSSNGSFCNIYHRTTFDKIHNYILKFDAPFDDNPMKSIFIDNNCYVAKPNLVIAQLETSCIRKQNTSRTYDRFKWNKENYDFFTINLDSELIYKCENTKINDKLFIIGITTFNRIKYLQSCINTLFKSFNKNIDYIIIIADGNSSDNTQDYIKNLKLENNISLYLICNYEHFIYRQSNSILKYSLNFDFDFGFIINDDLLFIKDHWDLQYYSSYIKNNMDHLVYYDTSFKEKYHSIYSEDLQSFCSAKNCQGALFTFTKKLINTVGYFDEHQFKIRGHSHIDYTMRCCRMKLNNYKTLFDIKNSNNYIKLNDIHYTSSFFKLPIFLRELYKVDIYELERRNKILENNNRKFIGNDFVIK